MSKSHKKHHRVQAAFSDSPEKTNPEKTNSETSTLESSNSNSSKSEPSSSEPIKLERVLISDEFYWSVPGDVPASDRRYGMKMVPPGIPKVSDSAETSPRSSSIKNDSKEDVNKTATESEAQVVEHAKQEENDATHQFEKVARKPVKETQPAFVASTQVPTDTIKRDENDAIKPISENKTKVAATILPRADVGSAELADHTKTTVAFVEAKGDSRIDSTQQQTVVSKKIESEQAIPSGLAFIEEKDERSKKRLAWFALPLLLLLAGSLYEVLNNDEGVITSPVDAINTNGSEKIIVTEQPQVSDEVVITEAEVAQVQPVYYFTHVVVKGDTLWDLSQKYHNDPFRYPELAERSNIKNPDLIYPGDVITIATTQPVENGVQGQVSAEPVVTNVESNPLKPIGFITHVVVKGDTLWDISKKYLNNPFRYPEVAQLSNIKNPDLIYPGDIVRIQAQ